VRQFLVLVFVVAACRSDAKREQALDAAVETEWKPVEDGEIAALADTIESSCDKAPKRTDVRFRRLMDPRSLAWITDESIDAAARLQRLEADIGASSRILKGYLKCAKGPEAMIAIAAMMDLSARAMTVLEEFMAKLPEDDPSLPGRRAGLLEMRKGFAEMLLGFVTSIHDPRAGTAVELLPAGRRIGGAVAVVSAKYPDEVRPVLESIKRQAESATGADRRTLLEAMLPPAQ
jgi:hypothetical protein